jgi:hypothetical protein
MDDGPASLVPSETSFLEVRLGLCVSGEYELELFDPDLEYSNVPVSKNADPASALSLSVSDTAFLDTLGLI